jgi:hypothetical protein
LREAERRQEIKSTEQNGCFVHLVEDNLWQEGHRHNERVNGVFGDFTARAIGLKELWELKWNGDWNPEGEPPPVEFWDAAYVDHWMYHMKNYALPR